MDESDGQAVVERTYDVGIKRRVGARQRAADYLYALLHSGKTRASGDIVVRHHRRQLDALRGIAVLAVMEYHFHSGFWTGHGAVRLFFVLSGFLITAILVEAGPPGLGTAESRRILRNFFARRILRIWPAYYAIVFVLFLINLQNFRSVAIWHAFFASNLLFSIRNDHIPWATAAWWSLSVEEQFYLVWPFLMLCRGMRLRRWVIAGAILLGCGWHLATLNDPRLGAYYLPPASLDALGAGAALALVRERLPQWQLLYLPVAGISAVATGIALFAGWPGQLYDLLSLPGMAAIVAGATVGFRGITGQVLNSRILQGIGRISYGVYLYHFVVLAVMLRLFGNNSFVAYPTWWRLLAVGGTAILVASISWQVLERPANELKRHFPMRPARPATIWH